MIKHSISTMIAAGWLFFCSFAWAQTTRLINPILTGFYPDPSVVQVGSDYYLVNSTFSYFPGIPVFHSRDLKNWKQIGSVIDRATQMDFMGEKLTRGLFAPSISYHNGTYYVTCTDIDHSGNFIVTAKNPAGPWSNPVPVPQVRGIDPSLFLTRITKRILSITAMHPTKNLSMQGTGPFVCMSLMRPH